MAKDLIKSVSKGHTIYKTSDGTRVPGVTTITGIRDKSSVLIPWANKLGREEGIDTKEYVDYAAKVGSLAHYLVQCDLEQMKPDTDMFSKFEMDQAENALLSYYEFRKFHKLEPIMCEAKLVSDKLKYGGTCDCYCKLDGVPTLLDFKTGKSIYDEYFMQVAAYKELLVEAGYPVEKVMILRIGRTEDEGFETASISDTRLAFAGFTKLLEFYYIEKEMKNQLKNKYKESKGK